MIAHIRQADQKTQSAVTHCVNVARLAAERGATVKLEQSARLAGILHDMGKCTSRFQSYITVGAEKKGEVPHSPTGAIFAYERWYTGGTRTERRAAQIISMAIRGHHGGLLDCVDPNGDSPYLSCLKQDKPNICYAEATDYFLRNCLSGEELDRLFTEACEEITAKMKSAAPGDTAYTKGIIARLVLSCVVDADRWDTACFEADCDPLEPEETANWRQLGESLENHLAKFSGEGMIASLRREISERCLAAAAKPPGIYALSVPTGGGKTFSSLRFALAHAAEFNMNRIFYVIPYNTILEQNAADIREALEGYDGILEHYGTFISELEGECGEREEAEHTLLTERWNVPIILTSMVQFLNAAYRGGNSSARRFHRLARSVIVFDEIQALPKHCTVLFEKLIRFLSSEMECTVLLCTATQPNLKLTAESLLPEDFTALLNRSLKRVSLTDESEQTLDYEEAAVRLARLQRKHQSVLAVVNTKLAAKTLFDLVSRQVDQDTLCIHLSTAMCPAHRLAALSAMKERLGSQPVLCVSTMLIEAGVNISFPCVVRSLAGLPSIIQTAGRCNRHMELSGSLGEAFIWNLYEEDLSRLPELQTGQKCTRSIRVVPQLGALDTPEALNWYFQKERLENESKLSYPWDEQPERNATLTDLLGKNEAFRTGSRLLKRESDALSLYQAFGTAGRAFHVVDQDTVPILTEYSEGRELIARLCGEVNLKEKIRLMRLAQKYAVSVFRSTLHQLMEQNAVYPMNDTGMYALRKEFYDGSHLGLVMAPSMMDLLHY